MLRSFLNKKYVFAIIISVLLALSALSINAFISNVQKNQGEIAENNMKVSSDNGVYMIRNVFKAYITQLRSIANTVETHGDLHSPLVMEHLSSLAKLNKYEELAIKYPDGSVFSSESGVSAIFDKGTLPDFSEKDFVISDVIPSSAEGKNHIVFTVPLRDENSVICASLNLTVLTSSLTQAIDLTLFDSEGYYHLVDQNGLYVADVKSENALLMEQNFFEAIEELQYYEGYNAKQIRECFTRGVSIFSEYSSGTHERYAYCQPVGINNWALMTIVPRETNSLMEQRNISLAVNMTVQLALLLSAAFVYIYFIQRRSRKMAQLNDKCFRALSEQTGKVILEWNFDESKLTATKNFAEIFGREITTQSSQTDALSTKMVHPDDAPAFTAVFTDIYHGVSFENVKFRIRHIDGSYHWCLLAGVVVCDWRGKPYRAIGTLEDINDIVMRQEALQHKSEIDLLTGLYNKATTEYLIKAALEGAGTKQVSDCALMIVDIDNFKTVNDNLGHQRGDEVLKQFADMLTPLVRKSDIVGRIGGDEFFVFFRGIDSEQGIIKKAEEICSQFMKSRAADELECKISLSAGISFYPRDAKSFDELYKHADIALYRTKRSGKNGYIVYNTSFGTEISEQRTEIDSGNRKPVD